MSLRWCPEGEVEVKRILMEFQHLSGFLDATFSDHLCLILEEPIMQIWGSQRAPIRSVTELTHLYTPTHCHWLAEAWGWTHFLLLFQWFLNAPTTTWWRSTSREAWDWTTRRLALSSPSASLSTTTLRRLWGTSGCRLNPNPPPVLPHPPAARVLHTPRRTARISPTRKPPAAHRQTAATGLSIKSGRDQESVDFVTINISLQICVLSNGGWGGGGSASKERGGWQVQQGFGSSWVWIFKMHWGSDGWIESGCPPCVPCRLVLVHSIWNSVDGDKGQGNNWIILYISLIW